MIRDTANKLIESFYGLFPYETARHLANAQKELLHAVGTMIDEQIKWTDIHVDKAHGKAGVETERPGV